MRAFLVHNGWLVPVALACCTAHTVVETTPTCGVGGSGGGASHASGGTGTASSSATSGGGFCRWEAQNGSIIECPQGIGQVCQPPAGPNWCSTCECLDAVKNQRSCDTPPCNVVCPPASNQPLPSGGCELTYGECNDTRIYIVTCPGKGQPCQCHFKPLYGGKDELGNQFTKDICSLPPDQQLTAIREACFIDLQVK